MIRLRRHPLAALLRARGYEGQHDLMFRAALDPWSSASKRAGRSLGSVLAVGAGWREAKALAAYPFERIVLSGIAEPEVAVQEAAARDPRVAYELANAEALPYASRSFDLVLCKEALHHLARPVQGFYELLRVCRHRAVVIEPWSCALLRALERLGLTTRFERGQAAWNLAARDNHVYRFDRRALESLLASYYLESGARCEVRVGWISNRVLVPRSGGVRSALAAAGWAASWLPGAAGNLAAISIEPGGDLPPDPLPMPPRRAG